MRNGHDLTGVEKHFDPDDVIVTKTDPHGVITYANRTFLDVSEYREADLIGQPHNVIRHPDMPRCIFHLLWERIRAGHEIFAYVVNRTRLGNHYWVFAHVTPSFDTGRRIVGFHSNRRVPERTVLEGEIIPLYRRLRTLERDAADPAQGIRASTDLLMRSLDEKGIDYDRFIFTA